MKEGGAAGEHQPESVGGKNDEGEQHGEQGRAVPAQR